MKKKTHPDSIISWKRNGMYSRIQRYKTELRQLLSYPIIFDESKELQNAIISLQILLKNKERNFEKFGKQNNFKKYEKEI